MPPPMRGPEGRRPTVRAGWSHPRRNVLLDGPDAGQGRRVLPQIGEDGRVTAEVLRVAVSLGRGGLHLLLSSQRAELRAVDRAHTTGLHVQHQGLLVADE